MKKIIFSISLLWIFCFNSCKDDNAPQDDTIVGTWRLESVSDNSNLDCDTRTSLEFSDNQNDATIRSFEFMKDDQMNSVCKSVAIGDYAGDGNTGTVTFLRMDGDGNNFIPPPKNSFTYTRDGTKLILTTTEQNIIYQYEKN